ncbi:hypothetical protein Tco_0601748 [Tanacetum coccineum]
MESSSAKTTEDVDVHLYRSLIESLMYLTASRPDIMFVVCAYVRFQVTPKVSHLYAVKRIFRYLKASLDRKSTTRGCQFLSKRLISWQCKKHTIVANSTTEESMVVAALISRWAEILFEKKYRSSDKIHTDHNVTDILTKAFDVSIGTNLATLIESFPYELVLVVVSQGASYVQYALTINSTIYTTCIEQFWASAKAKIVNGERQIQALVDKKKVIITETSIRSDLKLDDAEGIDCLPTASIFAELERMGYEHLTQKLTFYKAYFSSQWKFLIHTSAKTTAWNEFSSTMAFAIICLATNQTFNFSKYIFDNLVKHLEGGVKFLMYPRFMQVFLDKQVEGMTRHKGVYVTPSSPPRSYKGDMSKSRRKQRKDNGPTEPVTDEAHVSTPSYDPPQSGVEGDYEFKEESQAVGKEKEVKTFRAKKVRKVGSTSMVESSNDASLGAQEDASKQGRKIEDLDADAEVTLVNETQEMNDDNLMFDTCVLEKHEIKFEKVVEEPVVSVATTTKSNLRCQKGFYHFVRANGSSKRYSLMIRMLQSIHREDLETLWKLVKEKHGINRLVDEYERVLWGDLKVMFEPELRVMYGEIYKGTKLQLLSDYYCWKEYADKDEIKDWLENKNTYEDKY